METPDGTGQVEERGAATVPDGAAAGRPPMGKAGAPASSVAAEASVTAAAVTASSVPSAAGKRGRNMRVETLRVAAIAGIAVFHVFQTWFAAAAVATPADQLDGAARALAMQPAAMWLLGLIALLGAGGNHVFYMISGFYLIPSAARRSHDAGYWRAQGRAWLRRAALIVASVAVCAAVAGVVNLAVPVPGIGGMHWLGLGLEFVWLYLVFVSCAPILGWLFARIPTRVLWTLACMVLIAVYALNAYIAFVSPEGGRGLGDWRKLMSALTYAVSYAFAGLLGMTLRGASQGGAREVGRVPTSHLPGSFPASPVAASGSPMMPSSYRPVRRPVPWSGLLLALIAAVAAVEAWMAWSGARWLLMAMSFKSTSLASFLGATLALVAAAAEPGVRRSRSAGSDGGLRLRLRFRDTWHHLVRTVAAGTLGFYIAQSLLGGVWHDACDAVMTRLLGDGGGLWAAIAFGCVFAVAFMLAVVAVDRVVRQPLMRALHLM
ncbi:hypothetical protein [Bifidobacterium samirii]|uniref:Acyltransferase n=1 Tax=Bifidobacterium samirii TaxID=2306974 RepID=A0A430FR75_9BIFI|nr:hypothetical protein [Bifidobacterium samirii]RSX55349.1 hypothetical protein D2E24_1364 [Bifidobacterium samirii]